MSISKASNLTIKGEKLTNTEFERPETWADFTNAATGTVTDPLTGYKYKYVDFSSAGTLTISREGWLDILVIAGGGSGGSNWNFGGAPGGAGGLIYRQVWAKAFAYPISVGAGAGAVGSNLGGRGGTGGNSSIGDTVAYGGGGGASGTHQAGNSGGSGGSGGGATQSGSPGAAVLSGLQGHSAIGGYAGGSGGAPSSAAGIGTTLNFTGTTSIYAKGGGGSQSTIGYGDGSTAQTAASAGRVIVRVRTA